MCVDMGGGVTLSGKGGSQGVHEDGVHKKGGSREPCEPPGYGPECLHTNVGLRRLYVQDLEPDNSTYLWLRYRTYSSNFIKQHVTLNLIQHTRLTRECGMVRNRLFSISSYLNEEGMVKNLEVHSALGNSEHAVGLATHSVTIWILHVK